MFCFSVSTAAHITLKYNNYVTTKVARFGESEFSKWLGKNRKGDISPSLFSLPLLISFKDWASARLREVPAEDAVCHVLKVLLTPSSRNFKPITPCRTSHPVSFAGSKTRHSNQSWHFFASQPFLPTAIQPLNMLHDRKTRQRKWRMGGGGETLWKGGRG